MSKYTAVSLFSGCGGFCEGVRLAGFDVKAAVEIDRFAAQTYRENFPEVPLFEGDVHDFLNQDSPTWAPEASRFLDVTPGKIDLLFGGPPCQGYSQIGTRALDDPRNELYLQFIRVLKHLRPKAFLMENVPNMLLLDKGRFKREVLEALAEAGYSDSGVEVVVASDFGVPQLRRRAMFFGIRDGESLGKSASEFFTSALDSEKQTTQTVWDALRDSPATTAIHYEPVAYPRSRAKSEILDEMRIDRNGRWYSSEYKLASTKSNKRKLYNHHTKEIQAKRQALIALLKPGAKGDSLPKDVWNGLRPEKWRRLPYDRPAYTILAQMHRDMSEWVHPRFERWITVREAARLQSFHDGFVFHSSEWQMLKQIGNAVPPLLARAVASSAHNALRVIEAQRLKSNEANDQDESIYQDSLTLTV